MAQAGEIDVASGGASSSKPGKNNPAVAENLVALARFNGVLVPGMHQAPIHEQERSGSAWMLLPQICMATAAAFWQASMAIASFHGPADPTNDDISRPWRSLVEPRGIEPLTSSLRTTRSPD